MIRGTQGTGHAGHSRGAGSSRRARGDRGRGAENQRPEQNLQPGVGNQQPRTGDSWRGMAGAALKGTGQGIKLYSEGLALQGTYNVVKGAAEGDGQRVNTGGSQQLAGVAGWGTGHVLDIAGDYLHDTDEGR